MSAPARHGSPLAWFLAALLVVSLAAPAWSQSSSKRGQLPTFAPEHKALYAKIKAEGRWPILVVLKETSAPAAVRNGILETGRTASVASSSQELARRLQTQRPSHMRSFQHLPVLAVNADAETFEWLLGQPEVASLQEDQLVPALLAETSAMIGADEAWGHGYAGAGQAIAVIDTGLDTDHPFLAGKVVAEACFSTATSVSESLCPDGTDEQIGTGAAEACTFGACGHGTMVAGIAAGRGDDFSGIAKDASIVAVQVFSKITHDGLCGGEGRAPCLMSWTSDQLLALDHVYQLRSDFDIATVNLSLGSGNYDSQADCDLYNSGMYEAVALLRSAGIATIAAAGNSGQADRLVSPACLTNTISVGATTKSDGIYSASNNATYLDLFAPGQGITTSSLGGGFTTGSGTSMAAPHVAGAWALLKAANPGDSVGDLLASLTGTGIPVFDDRNGLEKPRVAILDALGAALPVDLVRFGAVSDGPSVYLTWATGSELNNAGFEVQQRRIDDAGQPGAWAVVDFVAGAGTTTAAQRYEYTVGGLPPGRYDLRLRQVDFDGTDDVSEPVAVQVRAPEGSTVTDAYPNPFNPATQVTLTLDHAQHVRVRVYNVQGREVVRLHDGLLAAHRAHSFAVDAAAWPSGLYLIQITGDTFRATRKALLLK